MKRGVRRRGGSLVARSAVKLLNNESAYFGRASTHTRRMRSTSPSSFPPNNPIASRMSASVP
jgi:hypothetical protein